MSRHTPGPWQVSRNNAGAIPLHFQPPEVIGRNGQCCVASQMGNGPEAEANARLIAAAPELLAACEAMLDKFQHDTLEGEAGWDAVCAAREAIAKATAE